MHMCGQPLPCQFVCVSDICQQPGAGTAALRRNLDERCVPMVLAPTSEHLSYAGLLRNLAEGLQICPV